MSLRHTWSMVNPEEANTLLEKENTRKDIWKVTLLKKLHIKWIVKMTYQSQADPEEAQFKQVALREAYILQLALEEVQVLNNDEISVIYLYMEKNGFEILLSLTIYFLSK